MCIGVKRIEATNESTSILNQFDNKCLNYKGQFGYEVKEEGSDSESQDSQDKLDSRVKKDSSENKLKSFCRKIISKMKNHRNNYNQLKENLEDEAIEAMNLNYESNKESNEFNNSCEENNCPKKENLYINFENNVEVTQNSASQIDIKIRNQLPIAFDKSQDNYHNVIYDEML